ncbi:MAG: AAA family ATPase [Acidobacteria bacterium]|nr:AAA family ATPase [Acidobacteriota bacterium]
MGDQAEVLALLADPASYQGRPSSIERIDTHSASVFLAGRHAYKLKRAVRYSFLDFSTAERRRRSCEAEVRLNRRTAADLYAGVTPVTREADGRLAIGGSGEPVDWLVQMRRFPQEQLLDRLAVSGGISPELARRLADRIADFHAAAAPAPHRGGRAGMREVVDDNSRALAAAIGVLDATTVETVNTACQDAVARLGPTLEARRAGGFVRQCHGDLHLRNIVLIDQAPTLFDAVEFNDDFACIDVWYDLAFLLMDLLGRSLASQANGVFNQYLMRTSDLGGLPLLPLFLGCRAAIRSKTSLASASLETDAARRFEYEARARDYLSLAARLVVPAPPRVVAIGGLSGSGKSTLAAHLAPLLGSPPGGVVLRSDVLRKALFHVAPEEHLGPEAYEPEVTREVYRALATRAGDVLAAGGSVVVDATFLAPEWREGAARVAASAGAPFTGIWLDVPPALMAERLGRRTRDASDATIDVLERQLKGDLGAIDWPRLDATPPVEQLGARALAAVRGSAAPVPSPDSRHCPPPA